MHYSKAPFPITDSNTERQSSFYYFFQGQSLLFYYTFSTKEFLQKITNFLKDNFNWFKRLKHLIKEQRSKLKVKKFNEKNNDF